MAEQTVVSREQIKASLLERVAHLISIKDTLSEIERNDHVERVVKVGIVDNNPVAYSTLSVDGVLPAEYKAFVDNYFANAKLIMPANVTLTEVDDVEGHKCVHQRLVPDMALVDPRVLVVTYYSANSGDDIVFFVSS